MQIATRSFPGEVVEYAIRDARSGRYFASVTHGQFGPHLFYADDPAGQWQQAEGPAFPSGTGAAVERIWVVEPGVADGELWCGVAPAALFHSKRWRQELVPGAVAVGRARARQVESRRRRALPALDLPVARGRARAWRSAYRPEASG